MSRILKRMSLNLKSYKFVLQAAYSGEGGRQFGLHSYWPNWLFTIVMAWRKLDW